MRQPGPGHLVLLVCIAQVLAQVGAYTWPALLPGFLDRWDLDNAQAGWITSLFYAAYTLSVPILVTLTDRVDPKRIYLLGVGLTVIGHAGFAFLADGFWTAAAARILAGIGWAGTYMTGLKLLADRVDDRLMSRAVAGHAASIGISGALSFSIAGGIAAWLDWQAAFLVSAASALVAWLIVALAVPGKAPPRAEDLSALFDFRPVLRNRSAMAYSIGYCAHTLEMNALRGWAVAFLAWVAAREALDDPWLAPTIVATMMGLLGTLVSVAGNEVAIRLGRQRLVRLAMAGSILCALALGFAGEAGYAVAAAFVLFYGAIVWLDSSSLTAGAAGSALPGRRGATLALHSMLGYSGGFAGPVAVGMVLDASGGMSSAGWGIAFLSVALAMLAARIVFVVLAPRDLAGDAAGEATRDREERT